MSVALEEVCAGMQANAQKLVKLRDRLIDGLLKIPHSKLNGDRYERLPSNVNISFEGVEGESLILDLSQRGICVSSGSACTTASLEPSHVLLALGLPHEVAHGSLRLTLSEYNTEEEIDYILQEVPKVVEKWRSCSPFWEDLQTGKRKHFI